ncbi:Cathepsin L [Chionoecetes opilio]|uniref:Cathepsin L n=1 Tax=Chionoecetes opilio TaxID=41210 RepID=A0A8J5D0R7_CHIOP|nr:Cathepsin L [Chionoecetes opilio]
MMQLSVAFVLLAAVASASSVSFFAVVMEEWETFKMEHGKKYTSKLEDTFRMKIFTENKHKIAHHNKLYSSGQKTYKLKMNKYGDMLHQEFVSTMNGFRWNRTAGSYQASRPFTGVTYIGPDDDIVLPKSVDWREKGAVTPIKDQGQCGSCWSFSATGSLEGQHFRKSGKLVSLSEQNLIDCSVKYGNNGCNGGLMDYAFKYIKDNGGIDTENGYPYEGEDDNCRYDPSTAGAEDTGFVDVRAGNEHALKKAVATVGPVSVAIDASHESFQFYHHGVYTEPECNAEDLDHGVLVVGYGKDDNGTAYWIVKNSWGTTWGSDGFIMMHRNHHNMCGIASAASFPLV